MGYPLFSIDYLLFTGNLKAAECKKARLRANVN